LYTYTLAVAAVPVRPWSSVTKVVALLIVPPVALVTFTVKVHDAEEAGKPSTSAPDRLMLWLAGTAVIVPPPQEPVSPFGVETTIAEGNVSLKLRFVSGQFGLVSTNVRVDV